MAPMNRRDFLKTGTAIPAAAAAGVYSSKPLETVRTAFIGVGERRTSLLRQMLRLKGAQITAICDLKPERAERARRLVEAVGQPVPAIYTAGDKDYLRLCDRKDVDLVAVMTPWQLHAGMCVAAMNAGKHAATETPALLNQWKQSSGVLGQ